MHFFLAFIAVPVLIALSVLQMRSLPDASTGLRDFATIGTIALIATLGYAF